MLIQLDEEVNSHPIYYDSRQLPSTEMNYTITKQKVLDIIFVLNKFEHYLLVMFVIYHQATHLFTTTYLFFFSTNQTLREELYDV